MSAKLGGRGDGSAEVEEAVEEVQTRWHKLVEGELLGKGDGDEVEECQHAEHDSEHVVVDDGRVPAEC